MENNFVQLFRTAVLLMCILSVQAECIYWYTEQPPSQLSCDPYGNNYLTLSCAVVVNISTTPRDLNIEWYYTSPDNSTATLISRFDFPRVGPSNSDFIGLVTEIDIDTTMVHVLHGLAGNYYCQAVTEEGERLQQTTQLLVEQQWSYTWLPFCPPGVSISDFSTVTCAQEDIEPPTTAPLSMYTADIKPVVDTVYLDTTLVNTVTVFSTIVGCYYQFIKEPTSDITCNPYASPQQTLECNLLIDTFAVPFRRVHIQWLYIVPGGVEPVSLAVSTYFIRSLDGIAARVESNLGITNLRPGTYYCQLSVDGLAPLPFLPSNMAVISTPDSYNTLPACDNLSQTSMKCAEDLEDQNTSAFVRTSDPTSQARVVDMNTLVVQTPPLISMTIAATPTQNLDASTELSIQVTATPSTPAPTESTALALWVLIVMVLGATFVVLLSVTVSIMCCCYCARRRKKIRRMDIRPGMDIALSTRTTTSLLPNPTSNTTSPHYSTVISEGSYHYYSHPQWPEIDYHSIAEDSDRIYSYPSRHYFLASSRRRESECDDMSYQSSSYVIEQGATTYEEPIATATDTSNTAPHTECDNTSSSYVIATLYAEPTDTSNTAPHSDGYQDLDPAHMEGQHGYTDISQETKGPPTVSRGGNEYHTINPTLRETHLYTLPGAVGQRVRGRNSAQSGTKSLPAERSHDRPYQGLKIESLDYASLYNVATDRISKEQGGK